MLEWQEWAGGACPVEDDTLVDIHWFDDWGFDGIPAERIDWHAEAPFLWKIHSKIEVETNA